MSSMLQLEKYIKENQRSESAEYEVFDIVTKGCVIYALLCRTCKHNENCDKNTL